MSLMAPVLAARFEELVLLRDALLLSLEEEASQQDIPIVGPVVGALLMLLARFGRVRRVLELGAATGYSAVWLGRGMAGRGELLTLERDPAMARRAEASLAQAGLDHMVSVLRGEALDLMAVVKPPFDLIFMDQDKEGYLPALEHCTRLLRPGGLLAADNTGFAGAQDFTQALRESPDWQEVQILCIFPGHSPAKDGFSLAVRA